MDDRPFTCSHGGCGKSFARKEHLARHEKSHNPENMLQCPVCKRHFNRNDSLQRHMAKHGDLFKQNPSGRSKRACFACRAGKVKCDGNDVCSRCAKKGVECRYDPNDDIQRDESPTQIQRGPDHMDQVASASTTESHHTISISASGPSIASTETLVPSIVDWTTIQIRPDPQEPMQTNQVDLDQIESRRYLEVYYSQLHHRWLLIHRPMLEDEPSQNNLLDISMCMIGAWLHGSDRSIQYAVERHTRLMNHLMAQLCQVTSQDKFQQSLPSWTCMAAVLNIVFAFYYGRSPELSRAITLWNILISVLRDIGFFRPETVWPDDKPGYFLPMREVKVGERSRLACMLFKLSSYISILRNQPMTMFPEELHFRLPCTYALWNGDGLHIWEARQRVEPRSRASKSLYQMIIDSASDDASQEIQPMLIEDIHICLCALQANVWRLVGTSIPHTNCEVDTVLQKDILRRQLDTLKAKLDIIASQRSADFGHEDILPYQYYYGYEDHSSQDWQGIVTNRVKDLLFDTTMLYYTLSLHLSVDIRTLTQVAKDQHPSQTEQVSQFHNTARQKRWASLHGWASTPTARWALCQSVSILVAFKNSSLSHSPTTIRPLDPICHAALSTSALIVWAFCKFYEHGCDICALGDLALVEMTSWSAPGFYVNERDSWIEMGERHPTSRPQIQGIQVCPCNAEFLVELWRGWLPGDWELADVIAPGVFRSPT